MQDRRAASIARALRTTDKLDLARSYLETDPTVAAIIAWRELEVARRKVLGERAARDDGFRDLLRKLPAGAYPAGLSKGALDKLWDERNAVMHAGHDVRLDIGRTVLDSASACVRRDRG